MMQQSATLDFDRIRADTPGVAHRVHLNNADAGLMARPVLEAMTEHFGREATIGGYEAANEAAVRTQAVYDSVARLVGAAPGRLIIPLERRPLLSISDAGARLAAMLAKVR